MTKSGIQDAHLVLFGTQFDVITFWRPSVDKPDLAYRVTRVERKSELLNNWT